MINYVWNQACLLFCLGHETQTEQNTLDYLSYIRNNSGTQCLKTFCFTVFYCSIVTDLIFSGYILDQKEIGMDSEDNTEIYNLIGKFVLN